MPAARDFVTGSFAGMIVAAIAAEARRARFIKIPATFRATGERRWYRYLRRQKLSPRRVAFLIGRTALMSKKSLAGPCQ